MAPFKTFDSRWGTDRGAAAAAATLEQLTEHVEASTVAEMGAARAWAAANPLWMPQRIVADAQQDPFTVGSPWQGEVRVVAEPEPGRLSVRWWADPEAGWYVGAEGEPHRFVTAGTVEGVKPEAAAAMWLTRPWNWPAFRVRRKNGAAVGFDTISLQSMWQLRAQTTENDLRVPAWLSDQAAAVKFLGECPADRMRDVHAVAASLIAEQTADELRTHLTAAASDDDLLARCWAAEHSIWTDLEVAAAARWRDNGGHSPIPEHGEVWVVAGEAGQLRVGWWHEHGDQLGASYEFEVHTEFDGVDPGAVAALWIRDAELPAVLCTTGQLEQLWDEVTYNAETPRWLCDANAVQRVQQRRRKRPGRAGPSVSL